MRVKVKFRNRIRTRAWSEGLCITRAGGWLRLGLGLE